MDTYPATVLAEIALTKGFDLTPELIALLDEAYELGVKDTY